MAVTADTAPTTPFSRLPRFSFTNKSPTTSSPMKREEDWYIPYNGPYEPPKQSTRREKIRDSWGQLVDDDDDEEEDDAVLGDRDLHTRYGRVESERKIQTRPRAQSSFSGRTKSSGAVDPTRISSTSSPRQSQSTHHHRPSPAYISLSTSNGVGASPTPIQRFAAPEQSPNHRNSFAQFFSFGNRKSTIAQSPGRDTSPARHEFSKHVDPTSSHSSRYPHHPYASPPHSREIERKQSEPSTAPLSGRFPNQSQQPIITLRKASASTPNLREAANQARAPKPRLPKGKDRWFSPETWCDALFLPKPRFKLRDESPSPSRAARIMSPPGSPLSPSMPPEAVFASGIQSRVLAHSRSLVDLQPKPQPPPGFEARGNTFIYRGIPEASTSLRPDRPKSFALDDLALPSPIPSLSKVLEDGDALDKQRKEWHDQAVRSFQNSLSRNVSRSRAKSLGSKGNKRKIADTPLEFLAARTVLGAQATMPTVIISEPKTKEESSVGRFSHSHKGSLTKTISTTLSSSKSKSHSREDSWGRTAIKIAKNGAALCGLSGNSGSVSGHTTPDPTVNTCDTAHSGSAENPYHTLHPGGILRTVDSPVPSALSDSKVGIALSTPPPPASDASHATYDVESLRIPSHPYAQGGTYTYRPPRPPRQPGSGSPYGSLGSNAEAAELVSPSRSTPVHPYAQTSRDDIIRRLRSDSSVSPASKMWVPVAPGIVREVLPHEMQYSPYMSREGSPRRDAEKLTAQQQPQQKKKDRVSVGEALSLAMFNGQRASLIDNGNPVGELPERHSPAKHNRPHHHMNSSGGGSMRSRVPVQYDASRPVYQQTAALSTGDSEGENMIGDQGVLSESPKSETFDSQYPSVTINRPPDSVEDLDSFRDLFFKPGPAVRDNTSSKSSLSSPITWTEGSLRSRRSTGSGLTQLARQLSQEFEEMRSEDSRRTQMTSDSKEKLQFILAEDRASIASSSLRETRPLRLTEHKLQAFQPSGTIPEDVEASSLLEPMSEEGSDLAHIRVVDVGAATNTPPADFSDRRISEHLSFVEEPVDEEQDDTIHTLRDLAHLKPPYHQHSRDSYMTSSTGQSRMSGLSDFPSPPEHALTPAHASILESFFEDMPTTNETNVPPSLSRRQTFGNYDTSSPP